MKAATKKHILCFIAENLLNLIPVKMTSSESRKNREGNRTAIIAKDADDNKYSLVLGVVKTNVEDVIVSVDVRDIKWPERSEIWPEHFDFKVTAKHLEHGQLSKHRLVPSLPVALPNELCNKV